MIINVDSRTRTEMFHNKVFTKKWLRENTSFAYPRNVVTLNTYEKAILDLEHLPNGAYVWKPNYGRQNWGIALIEKNVDGFKVFPSNDVISFQQLLYELLRVKRLSISIAKEIKRHREWFAEEWIHPHERLHKFTDDKRCPPIIRLCGRTKVHFVVLSPVYFDSVGVSTAGWGCRKFVWLDFDGVIRRVDDMVLSGINKKTATAISSRGVETPFYGEKIEGVSEIIDQVNREVSPKLRLSNTKCWSVDGVFDKDNRFVVIEMNTSIGTPFLGVTWKK